MKFVKNYERMSENDLSKTYERLRNCVQKVIQMQEQKKNLADREALLAARDIRNDNKTVTAVPAKANASNSKNNAKKIETLDKALKTEQTAVEMTPNAKAKSGASRASGTETGQRSSVPGAKAKAVGVSRSRGQVPCSFFLQGRCSKGEACVFSHATPQADLKQDGSQSAGTERGRSSSAEPSKRSSSRVRDMHCFRFIKGICDAGDSCRWAHLTAEEVKAKGAQPKAKAVSPAVAETPPEVALPCMILEQEQDQDTCYHLAGVCAEVCAVLMDDEDNKIFIGRKHQKNRISAPRNLLLPDEFTDKDKRSAERTEESGKR